MKKVWLVYDDRDLRGVFTTKARAEAYGKAYKAARGKDCRIFGEEVNPEPIQPGPWIWRGDVTPRFEVLNVKRWEPGGVVPSPYLVKGKERLHNEEYEFWLRLYVVSDYDGAGVRDLIRERAYSMHYGISGAEPYKTMQRVDLPPDDGAPTGDGAVEPAAADGPPGVEVVPDA